MKLTPRAFFTMTAVTGNTLKKFNVTKTAKGNLKVGNLVFFLKNGMYYMFDLKIGNIVASFDGSKVYYDKNYQIKTDKSFNGEFFKRSALVRKRNLNPTRRIDVFPLEM